MSNPTISVIVPVYKVEAYLDRCVESILRQTFEGLEVILVDDGSPDRCPEMCDAWAKKDARIRVIHKGNGGLGSARNAGMEIMSGEYVSFVDSDDWIAPDMYSYLIGIMRETGADVAGIQFAITSGEEVTEQPEEKLSVLNQDEMFQRFFRLQGREIPYCIWDKLIRREVLSSALFWDKLFEDIDYNFQILGRCRKGVFSNQIKYYWFYNEGSITRAGLRPADMQLLEVWDKIAAQCRDQYPQYEHFARMNYKRAYMGLLGKSVKFGVSQNYERWKEDEAWLLKGLRSSFFELLCWKMPASRKALLCALCVNPDALRKMYALLMNHRK